MTISWSYQGKPLARCVDLAVFPASLRRLDFYTPNIRQKALRLIMIQIGSRETKQLVACIVKWPLEEIRIFLSEMISWMPLLW